MQEQAITCSIDGCLKPREKREWCSMHYRRWHRHGSPFYERDKTILPTLEGEEWRPVIGWEDLYRVSNLGRVWRDGLVLKLQVHRTGYLQIGLWRHQFCKRSYVARLVAEAFLGTPFDGAEANHKSGVKTDNRLQNLEWTTSSENIRHAFAAGLKHGNHKPHPGESNGRAILRDADIPAIRELRGQPLSTVAALYGVGRSTIQNIWSGNTWKHVQSPSSGDQNGATSCPLASSVLNQR